MKKRNKKNIIMGAILLGIMAFAACNGRGTEGAENTPTLSLEPTVTNVPSIAPTATNTPVIEPTATNTPPPSLTPTPTLSPTPTATPVPTPPAELVALMAQAERMAAGYDYIGAIACLQAYGGYDEFEEVLQMIQRFTELDKTLVSQTKEQLLTVPHIFFHSLIADTARAFDGDGDSFGYNRDMTTVDEFNKMMQQMYERGYVLVSPYDVAYEVTDESGTRMELGDIRLPEGKKPFILSQDDVNYYGYMIGSIDGKDEIPATADSAGDGFATKLLIDENGKLACEYVDVDGNVLVGAYDMVPLIEQFVEEHPDFSYHGAKGILGVTGFEGVFGYRTKPSYEAALGTEAYQNEIAQAKAVAECLKENGWLIASHTYGHPDYGEISAERVKRDDQKWVSTVASIIGDTDLLIYPYGSDIQDWHRYTFENPKYSYLYERGYRYFFLVDGTAGWTQLTSHSFRGGRVNADGHRMRVRPDTLEQFFDVESVYDSARNYK